MLRGNPPSLLGVRLGCHVSEIADPTIFDFSWGIHLHPKASTTDPVSGIATLAPAASPTVLSLTPQSALLQFDAHRRVNSIRVSFDPQRADDLIQTLAQAAGEPDSVLQYVSGQKLLFNWLMGNTLVTLVHDHRDDERLEVVVSGFDQAGIPP